ncbi:unnamed protein product [Mytilus coruscus]|uniref:Mutator-like transposase domain-containing protein n=1 Tax=Mytilus coruscus TaxID=42192 RepID=A0A6J8CRU5_MYTCO|nr:unnamed protein product [Mytilus coruscus]
MVNTKNSTKGKCILKQGCISWNKSMDTGHAGTTSTDETLCTDTDYTAKNNSALKVFGVSCVSFNALSLLSSSDSFDSSAASAASDFSDSSNLHPNSEPIRFSRPEKKLCEKKLKSPNPTIQVTKRNGICVSITVSCRNCTSKSSQIEMFQRITNNNAPGPNPGELNEALEIPVMKTKCGPSDVVFLLSGLNIRPPSLSLINRKVNKTCDKIWCH